MLVNHFLKNTAERHPDKTALISGEDRYTYAQIDDAASRVASALIERGVRYQDRVVIFLDNSVECVIAVFGTLKAGAIFIVLNPAMKSRKLNYILSDSGASTLIADTRCKDVVIHAVSGVPGLKNIVWCPGLSARIDGRGTVRPAQRISEYSWSTLLDPARKEAPPESTIDVDLATIIYTSGSTGEPKGVMSSHGNMVSAVKSISQYLENTPQDIILNALPLSFDYGLYQILMAFSFGGTVILEKSFVYAYPVLERMIREGVTGFPIVPTMLSILFKLDGLDRFDLSRLRYITNTAANLPVSHIRKLRRLFPHVKIYSMYGLTECKRVSYLPPEDIDRKPGSVGKPIPNEHVFIVDGNGHEVAPGIIGELVVRGANVMQGYWNAPEETAKTFRPGRYRGEVLLYSGDLFKKDEEGYLYFIGRKDDMIKTKGERVSPKEVENVLCELDDVIEVAVVGIPDPMCGQVLKAFIIGKPDCGLSTEGVLRHCKKNLEPFMVPRFIVWCGSLPKTSNGKIDKKRLSRQGHETIPFPVTQNPNRRADASGAGCDRVGADLV